MIYSTFKKIIKGRIKPKKNFRFDFSEKLTSECLFSHGGHLGDIVYSLPIAKHYCDKYQRQGKLFIVSNESCPPSLVKAHPNQSKYLMTFDSYQFIYPLLKDVSWIEDIEMLNKEELKSNTLALDFYRKYSVVDPTSGSIPLWGRKHFGINIDPSAPWIERSDDFNKSDIICCSFTSRYRNNNISYSFLNRYENLVFIGLESEYFSFISDNKIKKMEYIKIENALEAKKIIEQSSIFIGNQSFFFSISEALKTPRLLEVYELAPNVIPINNGFDFSNQSALMGLFDLFENNSLFPR
jgi:hypothetical protein